ncbi:hypothetical protein S40288_10571 [Stachybotrys chartarum IBT 40288]|nr:hypothetical protein S40288_10571 [Stachybotrys chartarum IBT 40288]
MAMHRRLTLAALVASSLSGGKCDAQRIGHESDNPAATSTRIYTWPLRFWTKYPASDVSTSSAAMDSSESGAPEDGGALTTTAALRFGTTGSSSAGSGIIDGAEGVSVYGPVSVDMPTVTGTLISSGTPSLELEPDDDLVPTRPSGLSSIEVVFDGPCNSTSDKREDCRITTECDISLQQYPICEDGKCKCKAIRCLHGESCTEHRPCRTDDREITCLPEEDVYPNITGVCQCTARGTGCLFEGHPHEFCHREVQCAEKWFSVYPEFPQCVTNDEQLRYPRGRCACQHVDCWKTGDKAGDDDAEECSGLITCSEGEEAFCALKYNNDAKGRHDGYCTCGNYKVVGGDEGIPR